MLQYLTEWLDEYIKVLFVFCPTALCAVQCIYDYMMGRAVSVHVHVGQLIIQKLYCHFEPLNPPQPSMGGLYSIIGSIVPRN